MTSGTDSPSREGRQNDSLQPSVACIIPTLNAERYARKLGAAISTQTLKPSELLIVDSSSDDGTVSAFEDAGFRAISIDRKDFNHGAVRNLGARSTQAEILVFMTQDAIPNDPDWLKNLVRPIVSGEAAAAFARQVPNEGDRPLAVFARLHNYPPHSRLVSPEDVTRLGIKAAFFSNSCSAIRRDVFEQLGGFRTDTIMNEDMLFAVALLGAGHSHYYTADSVVLHSHDYTLGQTFRRYFDIGVVFAQASQDLSSFSSGSAGFSYVKELVSYLWREREYLAVPKAFVESAAKLAGVQLGKRYMHLPKSLLPKLSMHSGHWIDA
ncbi:MAG: glycosyltransferase [Trueperaceae bacterium]